MTIKGPHVITGEDIVLPNEEDTVFEIKGDKMALDIASTSLHHRVFDIHHLSDEDNGSHSYYHIYTQDGSKILVSTGVHKTSSFKHTTPAEKSNQYSWWDIRHVRFVVPSCLGLRSANSSSPFQYLLKR